MENIKQEIEGVDKYTLNNEENNSTTLCLWTENESTLKGLSITKKELNKLEKQGLISWWSKCELIQIRISNEILNNWRGSTWENWEQCKNNHLEEL